jgi:virulence factor Mce-like protein
MRRLAKIVVVLVIAGVAALIVGTVAQGSDTYKFDVIFDDARGLIPGQQVKIAGAEAGAINDVVVTSGYKARVEASITGPFQFHTNATCIIRPDGLIAENYLDCDPGTSSAPLLKASGGYPPTVPVSHTSEPVSLLDLFDIFNLPTRERFQALVDELGIATAGDGDQINSILQRANPTLQAAQRVVTILDKQTSQISTAIDATNQIATVGASHLNDVQAFIKRASALTQLTDDHSSAVEQAINKLPAFLSASTPALAELNTVATDGTPLLTSIHSAVPSLNKVDNDIVPFTKIAKPALANLSTAISTAIPDAKLVTPLIKTISNYLQASAGTTATFSKLIVNLIQHGWSESFLSVLYYVSGALSKEDTDGHMLSALLLFPGSGLCATYATTVSSNPECTAHYGSQTASRTAANTKTTTGQQTTTTTSTLSTTTTTTATTTNPASGLAGGLQNLGSTVASGVSKLLSGVGSTVNNVTSGLGLTGSTTSTSTTASGSSRTSTSSLQTLLNYLLK